MKYLEIKDVKKPVSAIVFGTEMPIIFGAVPGFYGKSKEEADKIHWQN